MDSVRKGQMPRPRIFGLELPLVAAVNFYKCKYYDYYTEFLCSEPKYFCDLL